MKKYILLGEARGIGGWQIYCDGRISYMSKEADKVFFICPPVNEDDIKLKYIKECSHYKNIHPFHPLTSYSNHQINIVIKQILNSIQYQNGDEVVVEATTLNNTLWAEKLSETTAGMAFCFVLHSHIGKLHPSLVDFYWHKYNQRLLAGMTYLTLQEIFEGAHELTKVQSYSFNAIGRAPLTNEKLNIDDIAAIKRYKQNKSKIIGYFGSLNKPHIIPLCDCLINFARTHKEDCFLFVFIGSSSKGDKEKIMKRYNKNRENYYFYNVAELFPVPKDLFRVMDVCIGTWGSARTAAMTGVKTIRLDNDVNVDAQGIIGITLRNGVYYDEPSGTKSIEDYLNEILYSDIYDGIENNAKTEQADFIEAQKEINEFLEPFFRNQKNINYYNVTSIGCLNYKDAILKGLRVVFGLGFTEFLLNTIKKTYNLFK